MKWLVDRLLQRLGLAAGLEAGEPWARARCGLLEGWVSVVLNTLLGAGKLGLGLLLHSTGVIADAVHSFSDTASSAVVIIGFHAAMRPPDPQHPFGHARAEHIANLVLAVMLAAVGLELMLGAGRGLLAGAQPGLPQAAPWVLGLLAATVLLKELMARFAYHMGQAAHSETLRLDGWHHRSDALSTLAVIGGLWGRSLGWWQLDSLAGLAVGGWIAWIGLALAWQAISPLLGEGAAESELAAVREVALSVEQVHAVHDLRMHKYGHFHFTTLHLELPDHLDVYTMHRLSVQVELKVLERFPGECVVHVDPFNLHHPLYREAWLALEQQLQVQPAALGFRDLQLWQEQGLENGAVEISVATGTAHETREALRQSIQQVLQQRFAHVQFEVRVV